MSGAWVFPRTSIRPTDRRPEQSVHQPHQPQVQPRVAIQNVAELVGDDALQFVAGQQLQAAARDADGHVVARVPAEKALMPRSLSST